MNMMTQGLDHRSSYIASCEGVLSPEQCQALIDQAERQANWAQATINTPRGPRLNANMRSNERIIYDDPDFTSMLMTRLCDKLPAQVHGYVCCGLNERLRLQRYQPGMHFAPHPDGSFVRDDRERSYYTVLIYLNDDFEGGQTIFATDPEVCIEPKAGMVLWFQHPIVHEGARVTAGTKYIIRTDLMFRDEPWWVNDPSYGA